MSIEIEFVTAEVIYARVVGHVTYEDAITCLRSVWADARFKPGARQLLDLRALESSSLKISDFPRILNEGLELKKMLKGGRIAVVAPRDYEFGMMRVFERLASRIPIDFKVSREIESAREWLGVGEDLD